MREIVGANQLFKKVPSWCKITVAYGVMAGVSAVIATTVSIPSTAAALDLSPLTNTVSNVLNKPLNSLPVVGPSVAKTTDTLLDTTVPSTVNSLTQDLPEPVNKTLDTTVKKLNVPVKQVTDTTQPLTSSPGLLPVLHRPPSNPSQPAHTAKTASPTPKTSRTSSGTSFSTIPVIGSIVSFFHALPDAVQALASYVAGKHINSVALTLVAGILSIVLVVFIGAVYMMLARARLGLTTIGHDIVSETTFYRRLLIPGGIALGTFGVGSALTYLVLIGL